MNKVVETIHELGFDFAVGFLFGEVCSNLPRIEVERHLAQHPSGTRYGWQIEGEPVPCDERKGYLHYSVVC